MATETAGVQSSIDVNTVTSPVIPSSRMGAPHMWSWIWFGVAVLIVLGFHVRVFGAAIPPAASFP